MNHAHHSTPAFVRRHPELPAFCRTRRQQPHALPVSRLRRLELLLWLVLTLQFTIVFLVVSLLPSPPQVTASTRSTAAIAQEQHLP